MQKKFKKIIAMLCAFAMAGSFAVMAGCGSADDNKNDEGNNPPITNPGGNGDGQTPGGSEGTDDAFAAYPNMKDELIACMKTHDTETATYRFEAECTDLRGKTGPGWSGEAPGSAMAVGISGGGRYDGCVSYLYSAGLTVNFIVVCDRDVDDAVLSFSLGAERMNLPVTPDIFTIRVDKVEEADLAPVSENGAIGAWDLAFLASKPTPWYVISSFECPETSVINSKDAVAPSNFAEFKITSHLQLQAGVNCISLQIVGAQLDPDLDGKTTMECKAPCVDYMAITTDAQLGFYGQYSNSFGTDGLKIV